MSPRISEMGFPTELSLLVDQLWCPTRAHASLVFFPQLRPTSPGLSAEPWDVRAGAQAGRLERGVLSFLSSCCPALRNLILEPAPLPAPAQSVVGFRAGRDSCTNAPAPAAWLSADSMSLFSRGERQGLVRCPCSVLHSTTTRTLSLPKSSPGTFFSISSFTAAALVVVHRCNSSCCYRQPPAFKPWACRPRPAHF